MGAVKCFIAGPLLGNKQMINISDSGCLEVAGNISIE
ncbi:MAG: hypothetical protein ACJAV5_001635 [Vicingaceae bacterium]|jgi:hypothetical protein